MAKLYKSSKDHELYYYFTSKKEQLWMYRHKYYDQTGKRKEKKKRGFKTEEEAYKALLEVKVSTLRGEAKKIEHDNLTVSDWLDIWFETHKNEWKPTTIRQREMAIRLQFKPRLGHYKLQELDKTTYKRVFINHLLAKYNVNTVKLFHRLFKIAINAAVDDEILSRNRFTKISIKDPLSEEQDSVEENFLIAPELNKLLKTTKEHANITTYTIILVLAYTGLRRGEAYGLKWNDIDFDNKTISVNRTRDNSGTRSPKTNNSYRTILIDDFVVKQLKVYKKWCKETLLFFGKKMNKDTFVFLSYQTGEPVTTSLILYALRKMIKIAEIKPITPHGLRHTHATLLISKGVNVKVIADRLGNTPGMILDIYGHSFKQLEEESVSLFSESLLEAGAIAGATSKRMPPNP